MALIRQSRNRRRYRGRASNAGSLIQPSIGFHPLGLRRHAGGDDKSMRASESMRVNHRHGRSADRCHRGERIAAWPPRCVNERQLSYLKSLTPL